MDLKLRLRPLAAGLALTMGSHAFAAGPGGATVEQAHRLRAHAIVPAGATPVTNCDDAGPGSLRDTVAAAASGDTLDLTQLTCSTITLTSGAINVLQDDILLVGPGAALLAIDGGGQSRVMNHSGMGTLQLDSLTFKNGFAQPRGGCVLSFGNIALLRSVVSDCTARGDSTRGGGIFVIGDLTIADSVITRNLADGQTSPANGGGFFSGGYLRMQYTTLSDNEARTTGMVSGGGGAATFGDVFIAGSTISGNRAKIIAGLGFDGQGTAVIVDSTVSGNVASDAVIGIGGVYNGLPLSIYNSTIAFNSPGGVYVYGQTLHLESTVIADNEGGDLVVTAGGIVSGTHNLIIVANVAPPDTISGCPHLQPLADNGGSTLTHALTHASAAIDAGNNLMALANDQRGRDFARVVGANADIGAFEWDGFDDTILISGFEPGCER